VSSTDELVLALDAAHVRNVLSRLPGEQIRYAPETELVDIIDSLAALPGGNDARIIAPRSKIETMVEYRQPTIYAVVHRDGHVLGAQRTKKSVEGRLHGKRLIGFGGHVGMWDMRRGPLFGTLVTSLMRELEEELGLDRMKCSAEVAGLICDDSTDVNRVHLGIVAMVEAPDNFEPYDGELVNFEWLHASALVMRLHELESWSQFVASDLISVRGFLPRVVR